MAVNIKCSQCGTNLSVAEAFPGIKVNCPQCKAVLILALDVTTPSHRPVVPPQKSKVSTPDDTSLDQLAICHLERWLDVPRTQIQSVLEMISQEKAYTIWRIPKGDSNLFREITAPCEPLKTVQRRILDRLLYRVAVSNASHGFVPGRSIVTNAMYHLRTAGSVLNLDLKDAFPSVDSTRVKHLFVRYLKTSLQNLGENIHHSVLDKVVDLLIKLTTHKNQLPQGGPCSGYLLNIACITLDKNVYRLLRKYGESYLYTRYADDITISSPKDIAQNIQDEVQKVVHNCGFQVNPKKSHYAVRSQGQLLEVTGLILEKGQVRIPAEKIETFRAIIHLAANIATDQLTQEKRLEIQSIVAFVKMVYGKIPHRIWAPYKAYMEKHGILYPRKTMNLNLDLYPHK